MLLDKPVILWSALALSILFGAGGQIFMKEAMKVAGPVPLEKDLLHLAGYFFHAILTWQIFAVGVCYGLSIVLWLSVLSVADLSLVRPFMSVGYLVTLGYGIYAGEDVTPYRIAGTLLIIGGTFLLIKDSV